MQQARRFVLLAISLVTPLFLSGSVFAAANPTSPSNANAVVQELHVVAIVPGHRDIVLDRSGNIIEITSNTLEDVTPTVYIGTINAANNRPLSDELFARYRQLVPEGTAAYGVLYKQKIQTASVRDLLTKHASFNS